MKKITFLLFTCIGLMGFSQEFPLDFTDPLDLFSGAGPTTTSIEVNPAGCAGQGCTGNVLQINGGGEQFTDPAELNLARYVDLSDSNTNSVTFEFYAGRDGTLLVQFGDAAQDDPGENGFPVEIQVPVTLGLNIVDIDFDNAVNGFPNGADPVTLDKYGKIALFVDFAETAQETHWVDNIDGGVDGGPTVADPIPSGPAPVPTITNGEVYSIYNDTNGFTNVFPVQYSFGSVSEVDLGSGSVNNALKFDFGIAGWGQGEGGPDDVSAYGWFTFDYWAGPSAGASGWNIELIHNVGGTVAGFQYQFTAPDQTVVEGAWTSVSVPISVFTGQGFDPANLFQWKLDPLGQDVNNAQIVYVDNIMFTNRDILSTEQFVQDEYAVAPNPSKDVWNIKAANNQNVTSVVVFDMLGKQVLSLEPNSNEVVLNAADLRSGIYLAKLSTANGSKTIKLVKN